jgi:hypothetical protein
MRNAYDFPMEYLNGRDHLLGRPLHRWKTVVKLDLTSVSATLLASAATLKWHKVPVFVVLFYFCIVFGEYQ